MNKLYAAIVGAALSSGCVSNQCLPRCENDSLVFNRNLKSCNWMAESNFKENGNLHRAYNTAYLSALESLLGTTRLFDRSYHNLDPEHFAEYRARLEDAYDLVVERHPFMQKSKTITYTTIADTLKYSEIEHRTSLQKLNKRLQRIQPPKKQTSIGYFLDGLDNLFGWMIRSRN